MNNFWRMILALCIIGFGVGILFAVSKKKTPTQTLSPAAINSPPLQKIALSPSPQSAPTPHPVSLPALAQKDFNGRDFTVGRVLDDNSAYSRYYITYKSGDLTISGIMNKPKGDGPFPVLILNHGYIDPAIYTNGRGLKREQDYLVKKGYVVVHPDYRNHADSSKDPDEDANFRLGYIEDVINAVKAIRAADLPYVNKDKIGMLGHSMGGGVTLGVLITQPDLIKAAVLFAPVSASAKDNFDKYTSNRPELAQKVIELFGTPEAQAEFWKAVSIETYLNKVNVPIMIHHGTIDTSTPIEWSNKLEKNLKDLQKSVTYHVYPGEPHEFINAWPTVMQRTTEFFNQQLK